MGESERWILRLRHLIIDTAVHCSCYGNEKRRPCYRLVSVICLASCIALFVLASQQSSPNHDHHTLQARRNLLHLDTTQVPRYEKPYIINTKLVKPYNFKITNEPINSFKSCKDTYLLIIVSSSPEHVDRRNAIRETWGSDKSLSQYKSAVVFALGHHAGTESEVDREILAHGDILRGNFEDTYANLTLKSTLMLKYASAACEARGGPSFVMKTDDDMFVNVPLLVSALKRDFPGKHRVITGSLHYTAYY